MVFNARIVCGGGSTYDLNPPLPTGNAPPVDLAHCVGGITFIAKPNKRKARGVTRDPHLRATETRVQSPYHRHKGVH